MSIYSDYELNVAKDAGARPVEADTAFKATFGEIRRTTGRLQELTGTTMSVGNFYNPRFDEGLSLVGGKKVGGGGSLGVSSGMIKEQQQYGMERQDLVYESPTRDLYAKYEKEIVEAGGQPLEAIDQEYGDTVREAEKDVNIGSARASTATMIFGSIAGGAQTIPKDPLQIMSLPIGGTYKGGSMIAYAVKEALLQGSVGVGTEFAIQKSNEDVKAQAGLEDRDESLNYLMAGGAGLFLGGLTGLGSSAATRRSVAKAVDKLQGKDISNADEAALSLVEELKAQGYKFDPRQKHIIETALDAKRTADGNIAHMTPDEQRVTASTTEAMERRSKGEAVPGDEQVINDAAGRVPYDNAKVLDNKIEMLKAEIKAREKLEIRDRPSKPMKEMQKALKEVEGVKAQVQSTQKSLSKSTEKVLDAIDNQHLAEGRAKRAGVEYQGAKRHVDSLRKKVADMEAKGRKPKARQIAELRKAEEGLDKLKGALDAAAENRKAAKKRLDLEQGRKANAERKMNEAYTDPKMLEGLNESAWGFKWKQRKVPKGKTVRPAQDVVSTADAGSPKARRPKVEAPENGGPEQRAMETAEQRFEDLAARVDAPEESVVGALKKEIEDSLRMRKGIEQAMACNRSIG